jgi:hypothetical protein
VSHTADLLNQIPVRIATVDAPQLADRAGPIDDGSALEDLLTGMTDESEQISEYLPKFNDHARNHSWDQVRITVGLKLFAIEETKSSKSRSPYLNPCLLPSRLDLLDGNIGDEAQILASRLDVLRMRKELMPGKMEVDFLLPKAQSMSLIAFRREFLVAHSEMSGLESYPRREIADSKDDMVDGLDRNRRS